MKNRIVAMVMASALSGGLLLWQAPVSAEEPTDAPKAEAKKDAKEAKEDKKEAKKAAKKAKESEDKADKSADKAP